MPEATTFDAMTLAWMGAVFLLFGEIAALASMPNLVRVLVVSTVAEAGYVLIGFGLGGAAGDSGAWMHIAYQAVMRGLVVAAGWHLIRRTGSANLDDLRGSGHAMPLVATLFGFGMFSVMGLSPFKGSFSKFLILYAAIEQGQWLLAAVGTAASVVAAVYYLLVIQRVCLERPDHRTGLAPGPAAALPLAAALAAVTVLISLWPHPVLLLAESLAGVAGTAAVPEFESPWALPVLVPYAGGFVVYAIGRTLPRCRDAAAAVLAAVTVAVVALAPLPDPLSRLFALLFAGIAAVMVVYSLGYMARHEWTDRYHFFLFLMTGSLLGVATAHEFGNFYVFWELMTWTSYFLIVQEGTPKALRAGFVYFLMCAGGAYVMHFGILLLHAQVGSFEFAAVAAAAPSIPAPAGLLAVACLFVGFAVKAGLVPLHAWLPVAHPQAPSPVSGPLSGILTKAGVFGMVKVLGAVLGAAALSRLSLGGIDAATLLTLLGCATLLYGEVRALLEPELKRMLAFSTLAQVGEIAAVLGLGTALATDAALLHVTNHAVMKTLLFYAAGGFVLRTGLRRVEDFAGLGRVMPVTAGAFALGAVAIMGLPPFCGFVSKFLMVWAAVDAGHVEVAAALLLGGIVAVVYYARVVATLFFRPYTGTAQVGEAPAAMLAAIVALAGAVVAGGLARGWQLGLVSAAGAVVTARAGLVAAVLPDLAATWTAAAALAMLGAVAVPAVGRWSVAWAGRLAVAVLVAAVAAVLAEAGRYDALSLAFALPVAGVGALNLLHATAYLARGHAQPRFHAVFLVMVAGLLGMTGSGDLFSFFFFWELMSGWALWAAIIHEETDAARREGFKYFLFNTVGAGFLFLGVAMLGTIAGSFDLGALAPALAAAPAGACAAAIGAVVLGLVMKAAMLPVRIDWQMHPALAPTPVSGYISAVLLKSGPWAMLKLLAACGGVSFLATLGGTVHGQPVLLTAVSVIAGLTILYAGAMAVVQSGIKLLLIYSTVCQLGYVLLAVSFGTSLGVAAGLMHLINHMLLKDTLFLVAGAVMVATRATTLDELGGLGRRMPVTFAIFLFAGLSLAGIPPLNGFASKWLIFEAAFRSGHWLVGAAAMVASLFTLAAVLKFAHAAFMGAPTARTLAAREAPAAMLVPMGVLATASAVLGLFPGLLLVPIAAIQVELGMEPVAATLTGPLPGLEGWNPSLLTALLLLVGMAVFPWLRLGWRKGIVRTAPHQCGASDLPPERSRIAAAGLYDNADRAIRGWLDPHHPGPA